MACFVEISYHLHRSLAHITLLVQSEQLTQDICTELAQQAHPTLLRLLPCAPCEEALPSHYFVYGIHVSPTHASFLVHFPQSLDEAGNWQFAQAVLAKCRISVSYNGEDEDDLFILRWRLCVALLGVIRHLLLLEQTIGGVSPRPQAVSTKEEDLDRLELCSKRCVFSVLGSVLFNEPIRTECHYLNERI